MRYNYKTGTTTFSPSFPSMRAINENEELHRADEMLNSDNNNLNERIYELERKVQSQQDELICLRSSTANLFRRLIALEELTGNRLESKKTNFTNWNSHKIDETPYNSAESTSRSISNLQFNTETLSRKGVYHSTVSLSPDVIRNQQDYRTPTKPCNTQLERYSRSSPLRKWVSSANMQGASSQLSVSALRPLKNTKSVNKFGSVNNVAKSNRSLNLVGIQNRDPIYLPDQQILQVFINGKTTSLAIPQQISHMDLLYEIDAPDVNPTLEWVYGYRGKDSRRPLHSLPTGEIIYFAGSIVVLHNISEKTQRHYVQHTAEVKCIDIHPNKLYVASGQSSKGFHDKAHVRIWHSATLRTLQTLGINKDEFGKGVCCIAFSKSDFGDRLVAVDESFDHVLSIWDWARAIKLAEIKGANEQIFDCLYHPYLKNFLISYGKTHFNFWQHKGSLIIKKAATFEGRNKPKVVLSCCLVDGYIVFGDSNGSLSLWDPETSKFIKRSSTAHKGGVWALFLSSSNSLISGGKDGIIIAWKVPDLIPLSNPISIAKDAGTIRTITEAFGDKIMIGTMKNSILFGSLKDGFNYVHQGHPDEVWTVCAHPSMSQCITASIDGTVRMWDISYKKSIYSIQIDDGVTCADFHPGGDFFAVGTLTGIWGIYKMVDGNIICNHTESHSISILKFSTNGLKIAIATKEPKFSLFTFANDFEKLYEIIVFKELSISVTIIDWSMDDKYIRTNNDKIELQLWCTDSGKLVDSLKNRNIHWASSQCIVCFENACFHHTNAGVLTIQKSPDDKLVAVTLDSGSVRLYTYPAISTMAHYKEIFGHSGLVASAAFVQSRLVTVGAKDCAILQWKI